MTATPDVPPSKGMMMIAAYRSARLRQRPVLRTNLHESPVALQAAPCQGQAAGEPARMTAVETPAPVAVASPEATEPAAAFASLVDLAVPHTRAETTEAPVAEDAPPDVGVQAPPDSVEPAPCDPPLSVIGFGPVMLIRLGQLGLRSVGDLAHADANQLRAALGDISRLVDVEAWIASARMAASTAVDNARPEPIQRPCR